MNIITYEEFKEMEDYKDYAAINSDVGYLKIQCFTAYQAIPIANAEITILKQINNKQVIFFRGYTDSSGIIDDIILPSPPKQETVKLYETPPYTTYDMSASHEGYEKIKKYDIFVYGGIKVLQYVKLSLEMASNAND